MIIPKIALICFILFCSFNYDCMALHSSENARDDLKNSCSNLIKPKKDIFDVDESQLVVKLPSSNIKLYYVKKEDGMYKDFVLQINDSKRVFRWKNETNPTFAPQLILSDLDKDGKEELVILLTKGHGTGFYFGDVHVIEQEPLIEILVENPFIILYKNVQFEEHPEHFEMILNNKKYLYRKNDVLYPGQEGGIGWYNDAVKFKVEDNTLYARVPVYAPFTKFLGHLIIKYKYEDEILQMESIEYIDTGIFKMKSIDISNDN
ncbi:hypothetical protein [Oceanirhabdus sp. W0125-5]|uniref:hypothetical protein n=1 Tax=Oceanirhabdus sp. W0125-5 TaxID=2999116 RepID=UPI0022F2FB14|nr:hypothetical protein [Oceanirhabdus sp. W0125-5]WBW95724.1 hypothetical protein OW730_18775 [Oceanirhabdus sp. W0125-5]